MKCSVRKKTSVCEVQGINSHPVFLMGLDLRPRVWHNEVGINPPYFMGCQLIPPPWSAAPRGHLDLWGQQLWMWCQLWKGLGSIAWGAPRLQQHQAKPGTTFPAQPWALAIHTREHSFGTPLQGEAATSLPLLRQELS